VTLISSEAQRRHIDSCIF